MADGASESDVKHPRKLPDSTHHVIVKLEAIHVDAPDIDVFPLTYEIIEYDYTSSENADLVAARVRDASILITTTTPINAATLGKAPHLLCVITESVGTDHIDLDECRSRNITVMYSPNATVEAVSEHALAMYFATRRKLTVLHDAMLQYDDTRPNLWKEKGSMSSVLRDSEGRPPRTCQNETVGIMGYGPIGQRIATLCRSLGMQVLVAARKPYDYLPDDVPVGRTPSHTVIRRATVLFVVVPLNAETRHIIGVPELDAAGPDCTIVNVGRGGTVDERALLAAVRERRIYGAATDVFETEPAGSDADSVLLSREIKKEGLNLVLTPHLAWCADATRMNIRRVVGQNIRTFVEGGSTNVVLDARV
ncbi:glycerate dehydrogenase [Sodiomyces alkalinus F11]|uniref:Glycerate dehydrogenase n=1 Tax=Sodiomyces alkalinus (strain CBS 110278 / VKM F-3762 / F11) TaxID=1314773 RepID=A0A3N2PMR2_SODAK|nr:glycerate dehydrogenase [Sodiomyces alkalinus F11]ROT35807.1 glycerate dehydrogenase [Sodiomyces alkalinus F11]